MERKSGGKSHHNMSKQSLNSKSGKAAGLKVTPAKMPPEHSKNKKDAFQRERLSKDKSSESLTIRQSKGGGGSTTAASNSNTYQNNGTAVTRNKEEKLRGSNKMAGGLRSAGPSIIASKGSSLKHTLNVVKTERNHNNSKPMTTSNSHNT